MLMVTSRVSRPQGRHGYSLISHRQDSRGSDDRDGQLLLDFAMSGNHPPVNTTIADQTNRYVM